MIFQWHGVRNDYLQGNVVVQAENVEQARVLALAALKADYMANGHYLDDEEFSEHCYEFKKDEIVIKTSEPEQWTMNMGKVFRGSS